MKERPILFSSAMVRAILAGTKTQTRRALKPQPESSENAGLCWKGVCYGITTDRKPYLRELLKRCPYGKPGDRLWVRESWSMMDRPRTTCITRGHHQTPEAARAADLEVVYRASEDHGHRGWRPSIHMPRWASRITLEVTGVRVERLHAITGRDVLAEGVDNGKSNPAQGQRWENMQRLAFEELWSSINGADSWSENPWVWVVEFKRIEAAAGERAA